MIALYVPPPTLNLNYTIYYVLFALYSTLNHTLLLLIAKKHIFLSYFHLNLYANVVVTAGPPAIFPQRSTNRADYVG